MGRFDVDGNRLLRIAVVVTIVLVSVAGALFLSPTVRTAVFGTGLYGKHVAIGADQQCSSCHSSTHRAPLIGPCDNCHTTLTWHSVDHQHRTVAMDVGIHAKTACALCHPHGGKPIGTRCEDCHRTSKHVFTPGCQRCHSPVNWQYTQIAPARHVRLVGPHAPVPCLDCHSLQQVPVVFRCATCHPKHTATFALTLGHAIDCVRCHDQRSGRDNLNVASIKGSDCSACHPVRHTGLADCSRCHDTAKWKPATFRHESVYPLTGAHARTACTACHAASQWGALATTSCVTCHAPRHSGLTACDRCHTTVAFTQPTFRHAKVFPLSGRHSKIKCSSCHPRGDLGVVRSRSCSGCHGTKHQTYIKCGTCHTASGWSPIKTFSHPANYPLVGLHAYVPCASCHKGLVFPGAFTRCVDCHAKLSHGHPDCERCHTPKGWRIILPGGMG